MQRPQPPGLASVDLAMDGSLRSGDALATADGLVAYSGIRVGNDQNPDFTPVASSLGRTPEVRARLNDIKVAPARADMAANKASTSKSNGERRLCFKRCIGLNRPVLIRRLNVRHLLDNSGVEIGIVSSRLPHVP